MGKDAAIVVEELHKSFGEVHALRGVDFEVARGTVLGVLGPNGAGKTTVVRILTTLLAPSSGRALVEGLDVVREPAAVREIIGLAGQSAAIQEELTGRENLEIVGRLYHLDRGTSRRRAGELLEQFELSEAADRPAKTYSGGMLRRLDLAASLTAKPAVLFLDEPTTGLDPRSRIGMWEVIRNLVAEGTTLFLTTQYLDEADELADQIVVIDHGRVIAAGTAETLKDRVGGNVVEFVPRDRAQLARATAAVTALADGEPSIESETAQVAVRVGSRGSEALVETVRSLDAAGVEVDGLTLRRPSLDDVFLAFTGHTAEAELDGPRRRGRRSRHHAGAEAAGPAGTEPVTSDAEGR
jgi:ABC-2 type transport system ATP-binding protein